jgi:hypothetical protein
MLWLTCSDYAHVLSTFAHEAMGAADAPGIPCVLSVSEGGRRNHSGATRRGKADGRLKRTSFRDAPLGAGPESITTSWEYGFSDAQLRIIARSFHSRPGMTAVAV